MSLMCGEDGEVETWMVFFKDTEGNRHALVSEAGVMKIGRGSRVE
jgi:hypothetical protein